MDHRWQLENGCFANIKTEIHTKCQAVIGDNFMVAFPKEKKLIWEEFIIRHFELGYWNEYITENGVVFFISSRRRN